MTAAHRQLSAGCFNRCWEFIEKPDRTADDDEQMLLLAMASLWHWTQRADVTRRNLGIGYWQVSRVYSLLGEGENAARFAEKCLAANDGEPPFCVGYAHEAVARAALTCGDRERMIAHREFARQFAAQVVEAEDRGMLEKDLETLV